MLEEVKNYLRVTWDDEDSEIISLIERGKKYLSRQTGTSLNFGDDDLPKQLLLDYCRYARNNALSSINKTLPQTYYFYLYRKG